MGKRLIIGLLVGMALTSARAPAAVAPAAKMPVIVDTDIGTDIDDAFALALVMASPELQLVGVTTVSGDARARARLAAKLLWVAGGSWRRVPVYAGESSAPQPIDQTRWADGFSSPALHEAGAVKFMAREIDRHPGEITIVAIGALTNVAALLKSNPLITNKIRRIALMGGSVERGYAAGSKPEPEWNIKSDPAAAQAVFESGVPILMAPLDVTAMLALDEAGRRRVFTHPAPVTKALAALYSLWGKPTPVLYDPMAVALLINPRLCEVTPLAIAVDAEGNTRAAEGKPVNAEVGLHTNPAEFFDFYLGRVAPHDERPAAP